jgi:NAD(P)-dependent dehydrogenase (short-subunit alcohol dehydrogenase family)
MEAGRIDVLFVNAGGGTMLPLGSITEDFLASTDASFIAGTELFVDGGQAQI